MLEEVKQVLLGRIMTRIWVDMPTDTTRTYVVIPDFRDRSFLVHLSAAGLREVEDMRIIQEPSYEDANGKLKMEITLVVSRDVVATMIAHSPDPAYKLTLQDSLKKGWPMNYHRAYT